MLGCTHQEASLDLRQRLAFDQRQVHEALQQWQAAVPGTELALLSTCNRVELYAASPAGMPTAEELASMLARYHRLEPETLQASLITLTDADAVDHLFRVAASLDSMVVGEPQILAQVKLAFQIARDTGAAGSVLHGLFQAALRTARRVANETALHHHRVSVASVAIAELATCVFERFDDKHVVVVGAGEMAEETLRYLTESGKPDLHILNRSSERGEQLAARWQGQFHPWEQLAGQLVAADLVVSTTAAAEPILTAERFARQVAPQRYQRPLVILDLAVPRDFDPAIGNALGVFLYSMDDLEEACARNREARAAELPAAEEIICEETRRFVAETHLRSTAPVITELREGWHRPKEAELERLFHKLPQLDESTRSEIRQFADRLVNKLLHTPMESLRDASVNGTHHGLLDALRRLFRIEE
jgi:glutamyl-tRNA reductase